MSTIAAIKSVIYDICLPVTITYNTESFQVDKAWIGGAFVLGILFGILATAFCGESRHYAWSSLLVKSEL
jgi:hypothetical protein